MEVSPTQEWGRPAPSGGGAAPPPTAAVSGPSSEAGVRRAPALKGRPPSRWESRAGPPPETFRDFGRGRAGHRRAERVQSWGAGGERPPRPAAEWEKPRERPPQPRLAGVVAELKQDCGYLRLLQPELLFFFFKNDVRGVREGCLVFGDLRVGQRASFVGSKGWDAPGCPLRPRAVDVEVQAPPKDRGDSAGPPVPVAVSARTVEGTGTPERRSLEGPEGGPGAREDGSTLAASTSGGRTTAQGAKMPLPAQPVGAEPDQAEPEPHLARPGNYVECENARKGMGADREAVLERSPVVWRSSGPSKKAGKGMDSGREAVPERSPVVWRPSGPREKAAEAEQERGAEARSARMGAVRCHQVPKGLHIERTIRVTLPDKTKALGPQNKLLYKTKMVRNGEQCPGEECEFARDAKELRTVGQNLATFGFPNPASLPWVFKVAKAALANHFLCFGKVRKVWIGRHFGKVKAYVEFVTEEGRDMAIAGAAPAT